MPESPPPTQLAQAKPSGSAAPIGRVDTLTGTATAQHVDGSVVTLEQGAPVYARDLIATKEGAKVALVFVDKTTFALGESGQLRIDELVYNPGKEGKLAVSMLKGAFAFVSGEIAPSGSDAMTVRTPVGTIGIRGTAVSGMVDPVGGGSSFTLVADPSGAQSVVAFTNASGYRFLDTNNQTIAVHSFFEPPSAPTLSSGADTTSDVGQLVSLATTVSVSVNPPGSSQPGGDHGSSTPDHAASPQGTDGGATGGPIISVTLPPPPSPPAPPQSSVPNGWDHQTDSHGFTTPPSSTPVTALHPISDDALPVTVAPVVKSPTPSLPAVVPPQPPAAPSGLTFHGTLGADNFVGGPTNDRFEFVSVVNSLQSGDRVEGGGGHDTLTAALSGNVTLDGSLSIHNVEQIQLALAGAAAGSSSLNAGDIIAAPAGTTITLTGTGVLAVDHLAVQLDASQFAGALKIDASVGGIAIEGGLGNDTITSAGGETVSGIAVSAPQLFALVAVKPTVPGPSALASTIAGGGGNNMLIGGPADMLDYSHAPGDVIVDFHTDTLGLRHTAANGYGGSDTFSGFDGVIGSSTGKTTVTLAPDTSTHVSNVQVVHGYGGDTLILDTPSASGITIDNVAAVVGSAGFDAVFLADSVANLTVSQVEQVVVTNATAISINLTVTELGTSSDFELGNSGNNTLNLAIASGPVNLTFGTHSGEAVMSGVQTVALTGGASYAIAIDGPLNVPTLTVDASGSSGTVSFDMSGETSGASLTFIGGAGNDTIIPGASSVEKLDGNGTGVFGDHNLLDLSHLTGQPISVTLSALDATQDGVLAGSINGGAISDSFLHFDRINAPPGSTLVLDGGLSNVGTVDLVAGSVSYQGGSISISGFENVSHLAASSIQIIGDASANFLSGGVGGDTLTGGGGGDTFRINNATDNAATITDFNIATDQLELGNQPGSVAPFGDQARNGGLGPNGALPAGAFLTDAGIFRGGYDAWITPGLSAAYDAGKPVLVEDATHTLYYDPTGQFGTGLGTGYSAIAHLANNAMLSAANIHLHA